MPGKSVETETGVLDKKCYRYALLQNGIQTILISRGTKVNAYREDTNTCDTEGMTNENNLNEELSAAALCIRTGGFSDPEESAGLSHFLEHMLFMGNAKYPGENDFSAFVSNCGGYINAYTDRERCLFCLQVKDSCFLECLDGFANMFISPLLREECVERELAAVHSEYELSATDDKVRSQRLLASLAKPESPLRKFIFGNKESLKEIPEKYGMNIQALLRKHWEDSYSAHRMTLVIQDQSSLDHLESSVRSMFESIPRRSITEPNYSTFHDSFETEEFNRIYKVIPAKNREELIVVWSLPVLKDHYRSKPITILSELIGDEGPGSIIAELRKRNLATEIFTTYNMLNQFQCNSACTLFPVYIHLTKLGRENTNQVCQVLFDYIKVLLKASSPLNAVETTDFSSHNGFKENIRRCHTFDSFIKERQAVYQASFNYQEASDSLEHCEILAEMLQIVPKEYIISARYLLTQPDIPLYHSLLERMTPRRACILHISSEFREQFGDDAQLKHERWFNIPYIVEAITQEQLMLWENSIPSDSLHLPLENLFIATNFELLPRDGDMQEPRDLNMDPGAEVHRKFGQLWYQRSTKFNTPKAILSLMLWSPAMSESGNASVVRELFLYVVNQALSELASEGALANMSHSLTFTTGGLLIEVSGFSEKIFLYHSLVVRCVVAQLQICSAVQLENYKDAVHMKMTNWLLDPYLLGHFLNSYLLERDAYPIEDLLDVLKKQTIEDLFTFQRMAFQSLHINLYAHGNITEEEARTAYQFVIEETKSYPIAEKKFDATAKYKPGTHQIRVYNCDPTDVNTCAFYTHMLLGELDLKQTVLNEIVSFLLHEPAFDYLRTKETLGYHIFLHRWTNQECGSTPKGIQMIASSQVTNFSLDHVCGRMDAFWYHMAPLLLAGMTEEAFETTIHSLIAMERLPDSNILDEHRRHHKEILYEKYPDFRRWEAKVEMLQSVTHKEVLEFFLEKFIDSRNRRTILIQIDSQLDKSNADSNMNDSNTFVKPIISKLDEISLRQQAQSCSEVDITTAVETSGFDVELALKRLNRVRSTVWKNDPLLKDSTFTIKNLKTFHSELSFTTEK